MGWTRTPSTLALVLQCPKASAKEIDQGCYQVSRLFAMEQHSCTKLGCKTGNITEVCKLMSGEKMGNRVDYSPSHQTQVLTPIHMEPVGVSLKTNKYDPSLAVNLCGSTSPKMMKNFTCTHPKRG